MAGMAITRRQREVYDFISRFVSENGYSPSFEEIGKGLDLNSLATVHKHITNLEKKGLLTRDYNRSRSIDLLPPKGRLKQSMNVNTGVILPLLGRIAAGQPIEAIQTQETISLADFVRSKDVFVLEVRGDSMQDEAILDGDYVLVEKLKTAHNGDIVVAVVDKDDATLKRFYRDGDNIRLQPSNANMKPIAVEAFPGAIEVTAQNQPRDQLVQKEGANNSLNNADIVKAKAAPPAQAAGSASPAFGSPNMTSLQTAPSLMSYASPLWTINSAGGLQRSFDAGKTWEEVNPSEPGLPVGEAAKKAVGNGQEKNLKQGPTKLTFRAVAAIGPEVWAGGSGATLYHSADSGSRWQQVLFSADASPTGDIMTIHFSDPQHGTLATSTSEVWTTANNGQTWQKQQ